jgi:hypothetical protein
MFDEHFAESDSLESIAVVLNQLHQALIFAGSALNGNGGRVNPPSRASGYSDAVKPGLAGSSACPHDVDSVSEPKSTNHL